MPFTPFLRDETGAITVDWVVLTAGVVGIGLATVTAISLAMNTGVNDIDDAMNAPSIVTKLRVGMGYTPFDASQFDTLSVAMAGLGADDLAQVSAFGNTLTGQIDGTTDADTVGRVADFNQAIDLAYADAGLTRTGDTAFDEAEMSRISLEAGFGPTLAAAD
ncbi:MAG: hypothetical protein AAFY65_08420 [Pseudomonadota bacterium]